MSSLSSDDKEFARTDAYRTSLQFFLASLIFHVVRVFKSHKGGTPESHIDAAIDALKSQCKTLRSQIEFPSEQDDSSDQNGTSDHNGVSDQHDVHTMDTHNLFSFGALKKIANKDVQFVETAVLQCEGFISLTNGRYKVFFGDGRICMQTLNMGRLHATIISRHSG